MRVVINRCYGGYGLSEEAYKKLGVEFDGIHHAFANDRTNPLLLALIDEMGSKADRWFSCLEVVEIPDNVDFTIEEYDGLEWVAERHRTWP